MSRLTIVAVALFGALTCVPASAADTLDQIEKEGMERSAEGRDAQAAINKVSDKTRDLVEEYGSELKLVEGLETYVAMLQRQLDAQDREIVTLQGSIGEVAVIERQILPLMSRMIDTLEEFVELDVPFLLVERRQRIERLRELLERADVTVAEKCRRVFEAYQIETEYGRTIEAYKAKLALDSGSFDADFLRIGRTALLYQTVGGDRLGFWDGEAGAWRELDGVPYRRFIEKGLKVARQEIAPELISVPVMPGQGGAQ
ncbi:DUF3450 domain-containing protein [Mangrovimicrobium sediminis]|uniref:DUF3450 domain-containing protein n=1 Tax=Mangrovimicrobium sediminis TaxID=2562682 RepID=A0A4Z0M9J8_9GAMM|nr:DUF3450 domain-containing protein [Haliea sp. SAOS-164]TGD76164.1 DUF3450 domain-containing protein [Haliea sp. SAOS-164]